MMGVLGDKFVSVPEKVNGALDTMFNDGITRLELSKRIKGNGLLIFFILLIVLFYIANGYSMEKLQRESNRMERAVNELRIRSVAVNAELLRLQRASIIEQKATNVGLVLKQNRELPVILHR